MCTVDADDPALFSTTLDREYRVVGEACGTNALGRFAANAIEASFASPERKAELRHELAVALDLETKTA
jgi:adenosine deaminase